MNREEFLHRLQQNQEKDFEIVKKKNQDYAEGADPFQNFSMVENAGLMSVEEGIAVRMSDKMQRIFNLINGPATVEDEKIEDTLSDLRNYANILQVYLQKESEEREGLEKPYRIQPVFEGVQQESIYVEEGEPFTPIELPNGEEYYCFLEERE